MANVYTYEPRSLSHLGWDPCPGSPDGTRRLSELMGDFAHRTREMAAFLDGAGQDSAYWAGQSYEGFQSAMEEFSPHLEETGGAFESAADTLDGWARELEAFQERSLELDATLGQAREELEQARRAATMEGLRQFGVAGAYEADDSGSVGSGTGSGTLAPSQLAARVHSYEQAAEDLYNEYVERARRYGAELNEAGNGVWSNSWWQDLKAGLDDVGDWIEDSVIGDVARWAAPVLGRISEWTTSISLVLTIGAIAAALVPVLAPVAGTIYAASKVVDAAGLISDIGMAMSGHGSWTDVKYGLLGLVIGRGVMTLLPVRSPRNLGISSAASQIPQGGRHASAPHSFSHAQMIRRNWQQHTTNQWSVSGERDDQRWRAYRGVESWELRDGHARLKEVNGKLET